MKFEEALLLEKWSWVTSPPGEDIAGANIIASKEARAFKTKHGTDTIRSTDRRALYKSTDKSMAMSVIQQSFQQMYAALHGVEGVSSVVSSLKTAEQKALRNLKD